jgi:hypothetical protein
MCCAALTTYLLLFAARGVVKAAAQPEMLTVKRLAVVDEKGTERVVIAAPLPDPLIQGKRMKRDGPASGIANSDLLRAGLALFSVEILRLRTPIAAFLRLQIPSCSLLEQTNLLSSHGLSKKLQIRAQR